MRLEFNILWVEDQPANVESQRFGIEMALRKEGFRLQTKFAGSVAEAEQDLGADIFGDHVDLILMDYDLGDGPNGEAGLEMVREKFPFRDIVFYSARGVQKLKDFVAREQIPGVFCSGRQDLPTTVVGVFGNLVKKVLDIDHSRGIVMGATSEIDGFVNDSLIRAIPEGDEALKAQALEDIEKQVAEIKDRFEKGYLKLSEVREVAQLLEHHHIYTSDHRLRLLRKLLTRGGRHTDELKLMLAYSTHTVPKRNDLAHVTVERNGFSRTIYDRHKRPLTTEDMRALRVALLESHELFERVAESLGTTE